MDWVRSVGAGVVAPGVALALVVAGVVERAGPGGLVLLAVSGLVLVGRRRVPVVVLVATGVLGLAYQAVGVDVALAAFVVGVYSAVRAGRWVVAVVVAVGVVAALPVAIALSPHAGAVVGQSRDVLEVAWLVAAGAAGEALRQAEWRAAEAERTREEVARRRADEERLHIARELHDTLTHQISVITVQAEVAVHLAGKRGEEVPEPLLVIRDAGREASRELRATLGVLRADDRAAHGLDDLPDLVRRAGTDGLSATLTVLGERGPVPVAVDRVGYRVVQESLTNVARHAAATAADVRVDYRAGVVVIQVDDNGTAAPSGAPGVGLIGMRERVAALGGSLRAAPRSGGGFTVRAELPVVAP